MHMLRYVIVVVLIAAAGCTGDDGSLDSRTLPLRLEVVNEFGGPVVAGDLDGDGYDELVYYDVALSSHPGGMEAIWLYNAHQKLIDQLNFQGRLLRPEFLDIDDDRINELLVPFVRNDSLFVSIVDELGRSQNVFYLVSGESRREPSGVIPWDPSARFYAEDVDGDGTRELILHVSTAYARYPRGVAVYDLPSGRPMGHHYTGAKTSTAVDGDLDGDGRFEVAIAARATRNGAAAGGFEDNRAYVMVYEFAPAPRLAWFREIGGRWGFPAIALADLDGDVREEILLCIVSADRAVQMQVIEPGTWLVGRQRMIDLPLTWCRVLDVNRDGRPEVALLHGGDEVWLLDHRFERVMQGALPWEATSMDVLPDIDGDGVDELAVFRGGGRTTLLLGPDLRPKAQWDGQILNRVRRGIGRRPYLLGSNDDLTYALEPVDNTFYWVYRYGPWAAGLTGIALLLGGTIVGYRWFWDMRLQKELHGRLFDADHEVRLVVDGNGRIIQSSERAKMLLSREDGSDDELDPEGSIAHFVHDCVTRVPAQRCAGDVRGVGANGAEAHVTVEPLSLRRRGSRLWLVELDDDAARQRHSTVSLMMAQRVAHDIKNPLTSILLTLQRLQMEYQERAPSVVGSLDPYTERIIERIEQLRRMTRNFMKVVDQEEPSFKTLDPSGWLKAQAGAVRQALPPDIELAQQLEKSPPPVRADPDQLDEALTNLVTNAVEAMPEGGTLTLSTGLAYGLLLPGAEAAHDYVVIEVMDTGVGLSDEDRDRIFEPGFTRFENGTGLGLALVRRIVDDHEGHIEVEGEPGVGSAFTIYLPVAEPEPNQ